LRTILPAAPSTAQEYNHFPCKTHTLAILIESCGTSFRLVHHSASSAFHTQHRNINISNAKRILWHSLLEAGAPHFALRAILPPAPSTAQEYQHFTCKTHTLALPIGGCGTSFRLARHSASSAFLPQHRNINISNAKSILWHPLLGAAAPHFALRAILPPTPSTAQEYQHFHTLALLIGGCGTSFRLARHATSSVFHSTRISASSCKHTYFGTPY